MSHQAALPTRMWALIKRNENESYERVQVDVPRPTGDEVLIKVQSVGICGSDIGESTRTCASGDSSVGRVVGYRPKSRPVRDFFPLNLWGLNCLKLPKFGE